ncbi:MAG TPA: RNA polymerase sigma factor [Candidatus Eisenbacteria bacterium]|nr:RNA polymerase sigma factor [Candidatus Eisenbacteria bacterium]
MIRFRKAHTGTAESAILENLDALYGFAMSLTRNPTDAEDLVQEACLRAIKGLAHNGIRSNPKVWLFTILRNVWINEWRRRASGPEFIFLEKARAEGGPLHECLSDERERPEDWLERNMASGRLRSALSGLPAAFREVVVLRYFEGFSYREIATILGCPAGTVMSRLNRARAELRSMLDEENTSLILRRKRGSG